MQSTVRQKECYACKRTLPIEAMTVKSRMPTSICRECNAAKSREWRSKYPDKMRDQNKRHAERRRYDESWHRETYLKDVWGITVEQYNAMLSTQDGVCAICKRKERIKCRFKASRALSIDHDHVTGKIRGLLCFSCNVLLGRIESIGIESILSYIGRANG